MGVDAEHDDKVFSKDQYAMQDGGPQCGKESDRRRLSLNGTIEHERCSTLESDRPSLTVNPLTRWGDEANGRFYTDDQYKTVTELTDAAYISRCSIICAVCKCEMSSFSKAAVSREAVDCGWTMLDGLPRCPEHKGVKKRYGLPNPPNSCE